jgi:hypothetical protein
MSCLMSLSVGRSAANAVTPTSNMTRVVQRMEASATNLNTPPRMAALCDSGLFRTSCKRHVCTGVGIVLGPQPTHDSRTDGFTSLERTCEQASDRGAARLRDKGREHGHRLGELVRLESELEKRPNVPREHLGQSLVEIWR